MEDGHLVIYILERESFLRRTNNGHLFYWKTILNDITLLSSVGLNVARFGSRILFQVSNFLARTAPVTLACALPPPPPTNILDLKLQLF